MKMPRWSLRSMAQRDRFLGADGAVGPDFEDQPLVVGGLTETGGLDPVLTRRNRAVGGVERIQPMPIDSSKLRSAET